MDRLAGRGLASHYTKILSVHGRGNSNSKRGDHVWPEENFILIIYGDEDQTAVVESIITETKEIFPNDRDTRFRYRLNRTWVVMLNRRK